MADAVPAVVRNLLVLNGKMVALALTTPPRPHAEVVVDLGAVRHNMRPLRELVTEGGSPDRR